ncbi:MAG: acyltransferase [Ardenticatenaceae bacterium]
MKILVVIPTQKEFDFFLAACAEMAGEAEHSRLGRVEVVQFADLGIRGKGVLTLSRGGLGKVQFAVHTQHLLDVGSEWDLVICAGAAGALVDTLSIFDVVVSTETVEHDINNHFGAPRLPRFNGAEAVISELKRVSSSFTSFQVHFGPVASGDEDVVDLERRRAIQKLTGALAVAWEGAGGARACQFSQVPFVEIRGISDGADSDAASDFLANLKQVMKNIATLIIKIGD